MNKFEQGLFELLTAAETVVPIFVKSPTGVLALNVSEQLLNALLNAQKAAPATTPVAASSTPAVPATK